jgi:glycine hydroxymethyltransferase
MHVIAAKAVAFHEALSEDFVQYQKQVVKNAKVLAEELMALGYPVVSGGTDNHLMLVNVKSKLNITGLAAENLLHRVSITCNKNGVPFDKEKPAYASGIRLGTPAVTTRGFKEKEMKLIAHWIDRALSNKDDETILEEINQQVLELTKKYPLYMKGV